MMALIGGLRGILTALGGAGAALLVFLLWNAAWDNPRLYADAYAEGRKAESAVWVEAREKLLAQMDRERREAQMAIDQVERDYLASRVTDQAAIAELENEISKLEADGGQSQNDTCNDGTAIPRGLSNKLNAIGR